MTPTDQSPADMLAYAPPLASWPALRRRVLSRRWLHLLPPLIPSLLFLPLVLLPPLNHDVAAVLQFSERWLNGERLYSDLIDVNPPLIFVLNLFPALLSSVTPLTGTQALQICLLGFGALCALLSFRVRDRAAEGPAERAFLDVLPLLFLLDAGYDFGQREQLMAVGALPYLLASVARADGGQPRGRLTIGLVAGVFFALKPHFLGIPALVEVFLLLRRGWRTTLHDPMPWLMAGVWVTYLASLPLLFPDYLGAVVPLVWGFYLDLGGLTAAEVLLVPRMLTVLLLLGPLVALAARRPCAARPLPMLLALAAIGALASAVAQHKGWSYHILPIELFACALGCVLAARFLDKAPWGSLSAHPTRIAGVLAALFGLYFVSNSEAPWKQLEYPHSDVAGLTQLLEQETSPGERVLVLSPGISPIFPALNDAGVRLTLRTMNMWLLEGAYETCLPDGRRYREVWEMRRPEFFVFRTVAEDFARNPPAAVVVDKSPGIPWCGSEFDFIAYFNRHPLFAEVWSHYQLSAERGRYRVYTRKD